MKESNGRNVVAPLQHMQTPVELQAQLPALLQQQHLQLLELTKTLKPGDAQQLLQQVEHLAVQVLSQLQDAVGPCAGETYSELRIEYIEET